MNEITEFFTDPLRLTLLVAGVVVILGILIFGRRSAKRESQLYNHHSHRDFKFNNPPPDMLVDEEVIVLPPRKKEGAPEVSQDIQEEVPEVKPFSPGGATPEAEVAPQARVAPEATGTDEIDMQTYEYHHRETEKPVSEEVVRTSTADKVAEQPRDSEIDKPVQESEVAAQAEQPAKPAKPSPERFIVFHIVPSTRETFSGKEIHQAVSSLGLAYGKHGVYHFPADHAREGDSQFCLVNMTPEGNFDRDTLPTMETRGVSLILRLTDETKDGLALFSNMLAIAQGLSRRIGGSILDQTRVPLSPDIVANLRSDIAKFHTQLNKRTPVTEM